MKITVPSSAVTFTAAAKTMAITGLTTPDPSRLLIVQNTTVNLPLYSFADTSISTVTVSGSNFVFSAVPAGSANTDKLVVIYDWDPGTDGIPPITDPSLSPRRVTLTDASAAIAAAATPQTILAANPARQYLQVSTPAANTSPVYVRVGTVATVDFHSVDLPPGSSIIYDTVVPVGLVSAISPAIGQAVTCHWA